MAALSSTDCLARSRVLLIDDDPQVSGLVLATLRQDPLELEAYSNGPAALAAARAQPFELVLLDLGLPGMSGLEVLREFKHDPLLHSIPIIALTAWNSTTDKIRGFELGASDYITKPFQTAELRARVHAFLRAKRLQDQLIYTNRHLEQARLAAERIAQAKADFLAHMSHEIRTPLNGVLALAEVLLSSPLEARQRELVEIIRSSGDTLLEIVNDVLDLSKIEAGKLELECAPFDLRKCVRQATGLLASKAEEKQLQFELQVHPNVPNAIQGDQTRLLQVLINLVSNAVKFTHQGQVTVEVTPAAPTPTQASPDSPGRSIWLEFVVRDTGIGIPPAKLSRLFQSFSQADASTSRRYGGTGLGLAISKSLVEMMGGHIRVQSTEGLGSTFSFTLPVEAAPEPPVPPSFHLPSGIALGSPAGSQPSAPECSSAGSSVAQSIPLRILLVDDNPLNLQVGSRLLEQMGYNPDTAQSGEQAITAAAATAYDLILMDIQMPEMDGCQTTLRIRQNEKQNGSGEPDSAVIIAMTANVLPQDRRRCFESGMDDYLAKPVQKNLLRTLISTWGERIHARRASAPRPAPPEEPARPPLERLEEDRLLELAGGTPALFQELMDHYVRQNSQNLDRIAVALRDQPSPRSLETVRQAAHSSAGASASCGAGRLAALFRRLENSAREGSLPECVRALEEIERELPLTRAAFERCSRRLFANPCQAQP